MKKKSIHISSLLLLVLASVVALTSCHDHNLSDIDTERYPIVFASVTDDEESVTRATSPLARDFVVYGYKSYKNVAGTEETVFDGYTVKYQTGSANTSEDNSHGYYYAHDNQTIKYWDFAASEYNFWGATKALIEGKGSFSSDGTVLTISDLEQSVTEPAEQDDQLFSALYHRSPVSADVVQLQFRRPYAKVRVLFYTNTSLTDNAFDNIKVSDITFGPESSEQIVTSGSLYISYPKAGEDPETYSTVASTQKPYLTFNDGVVLDHTHGTASNNTVTAVPTGGTEFYYVIPNVYTVPFSLSAKIDNEDKTAVVPTNFMQWKPNFVYTYIFKISGGKYMEFYDVRIDPWHYGGSQEETWRNW